MTLILSQNVSYRAIQRQQYYPGWCKLKFAELNTGWVQPLEARGPQLTASDVRIDATSVCGGEVVARACVVKDLSEVSWSLFLNFFFIFFLLTYGYVHNSNLNNK